MKRLLLILLLAILPVQFTWAAAAVYCKHETTQTSKHFGHHEHDHEHAAPKVVEPSSDDGKLSIDNDCGTCHVSAQPSFVPEIALVVPLLSARFAPQAPPVHSSYISEGPQKPDWRVLV